MTIGWMEGSLTTFTFLRDFTRIGSYFFMLLSASFSSSKLPRSSLATVPVASGRGRLGPYLPRVPGAAELRPTSALYLLPVARPHGGRLLSLLSRDATSRYIALSARDDRSFPCPGHCPIDFSGRDRQLLQGQRRGGLLSAREVQVAGRRAGGKVGKARAGLSRERAAPWGPCSSTGTTERGGGR